MQGLFKVVLNRRRILVASAAALESRGDPFEKIFYGRLLLVHKNLFEANRAIVGKHS